MIEMICKASLMGSVRALYCILEAWKERSCLHKL